jgi:CxxC motif-containing protein
METLHQLASSIESTLSKEVSAIKIEAPIVKQRAFNLITHIYQWSIANPTKAAAIIAFIVGFILGTII